MTEFTQKAAEFASRAHAGQQRKYTGKPYFSHCAAVALLVSQIAGRDEEMIAAAYLHDTIEDTGTTHVDLLGAFGPRVAGLVSELTDHYTKEAYPGLNRAQRKLLEARRIGQISDDAKLIKYCDLIDNTSSIVRHDPGFSVIYLREKADILEQMLRSGWVLPGG